MPTYEMEVFRWSGTGYNKTYNTSYTATIQDDDGQMEGRGDSDERVSIDGGTAYSTNGHPYSIKVSFTDVDGDSHVETFNFFHTADGGWYFTPLPDSQFTVGATLGRYQSHSVGWAYEDVVCFASGTLIETDKGPRPVETLVAGDLIRTQDGQFKPLVINMSRRLSAAELARHSKLRPIRISAGSLGKGLPLRDLLVSRQHRLLISSKIAKRMFGKSDVLVAAVKLTALPGIFVDTSVQQVTYHHLLLEEHEVIIAEGAPAESLLTGDEALRTLSPDALEELQLLFPALQDMRNQPPASLIPPSKSQKRLVARHGQNRQPLHSLS